MELLIAPNLQKIIKLFSTVPYFLFSLILVYILNENAIYDLTFFFAKAKNLVLSTAKIIIYWSN